MKVYGILGMKRFTTGHGESTDFPILAIPRVFNDAATAAHFLQYDKNQPHETRVVNESSYDRMVVIELEVWK